MKGKVWLVGAGPGDAGLLTLRGREVLLKADVVVCDALAGPGVLSMIPGTARVIYAGKRAGHHALPQEEISRILLEEAEKGLRVVRLKGGDPFLFGRGGEELSLLAEHGIPFEVVPGVTSAFSVPAYQGIPVTHRDFASSVHVVTGHRREDLSYDIDFDALVRTGGTLVFLMGVSSLPEICGGLLKAGMDPDTPAALLENGTYAAQRRISGTLSGLPDACAKAGARTPAVIVVGKVCALAEELSWYGQRPLSGVRVVVTRPKELSSGLAERLREDGAEVLELPAVSVHPLPAAAAGKELPALAGGAYDWLVLTSPSGVRIFMELFFQSYDVRALAGTRIACIGRGTERALRSFGLKADFIPSVYDGDTLGKELYEACGRGEHILIARAKAGNPELVRRLTGDKDLRVTDLPIYETRYEVPAAVDERAMAERGETGLVVFTSASTVRGFAAAVGDDACRGIPAVCIGKQTEAAARSFGMRTWTAERAELDPLADCVRRAAEEMKKEAVSSVGKVPGGEEAGSAEIVEVPERGNAGNAEAGEEAGTAAGGLPYQEGIIRKDPGEGRT